MSDLAIATTGLSKQYRGGVLAVGHVDLTATHDRSDDRVRHITA